MRGCISVDWLRLTKTLLGAKIWLRHRKCHNFYNSAFKYINMGGQINRKIQGNPNMVMVFHFECMCRAEIGKTEL